MGMTAKRKRNGGITYKYSGDLEDALAAAKKELDKKRESQERLFLKWQFEKTKRAQETYERRITDLGDFIRLAEKELEKRKLGEATP